MKLEGTRLRPWQEVVGIVDGVEAFKESIVINISLIRRISLEIPTNELKECDVSLERLVGRRISILRTDEGYVLNSNSQNDDTGSKVPQGGE